MLQRAVAVFALILVIPTVWSSVNAASEPVGQDQSSWQRSDSVHFEIHYQPALAPELSRVVRSAERAYERISGRLNFVLATKVPLVMFPPSGPMTPQQVMAFATSSDVAPPQPHRSRIVLQLPAGEAELDALTVHELTHLLSSEIVLPGRGGDGGVPTWIWEGLASYMVGTWPDDFERVMRALAAAGSVPALSQLSGSGGFADPRLNDALGYLAFEYIENRWGPSGIRRFLDALIVPRVSRTYDAVLDLTPAEFDDAFRQYVERRFRLAAD